MRAENVDALFLVWLLSRSAHDLLDSTLAPSGLSADELALYYVLNAAGHVTPTELARWMAAPPTTVSHRQCVAGLHRHSDRARRPHRPRAAPT